MTSKLASGCCIFLSEFLLHQLVISKYLLSERKDASVNVYFGSSFFLISFHALINKITWFLSKEIEPS